MRLPCRDLLRSSLLYINMHVHIYNEEHICCSIKATITYTYTSFGYIHSKWAKKEKM